MYSELTWEQEQDLNDYYTWRAESQPVPPKEPTVEVRLRIIKRTDGKRIVYRAYFYTPYWK